MKMWKVVRESQTLKKKCCKVLPLRWRAHEKNIFVKYRFLFNIKQQTDSLILTNKLA